MENNQGVTDRNQIDGAIRILFEPDQVVEVRVPGKFGALSGYFADHEKLAKAIKRLSDESVQAGVYITLNPCHKGVLARRAGNSLHTDVKETTSDADIIGRRWLLIDFDPTRPSGVSATTPEKRAAWETKLAVRTWLHRQGWAQPVVADSGNGFHLLYRVSEPNDEVTKQLFRKCLAVLSQRFSTPSVGIDTAVFNAARITKAYGSLAAKGENTPDRPHRYSKLVLAPRTGIEMVRREQLEALAAKDTPPGKESAKEHGRNRESAPADSAKVEEFLEWGGVETNQAKQMADGGKQWILVACPFNPQHTNGPAVSWKPTGELGFHCFHESCKGNHWREFRDHVERQKNDKFRFAEWKGAVVCETTPAAEPWPDQPAREAFDGLAGEIVRTIEPYSEADPVALLIQLIVTFGNAAGRRAHFRVEADLHFANLFAVVIGPTSKGRKGTSLGHSQRLFAEVEPQWAGDCVKSGLSSGEGLIFAVRDPVLRPARFRKSGTVLNNDDDGSMKVVDHGVEDKRLLVVETEFAQPLKVMDRDGNILSTVIRQAWDTGDLRTLTKNSPTQATGAHISIIGHISEEELRRYLSATEQANGFGNRFLWCCARRSKFLPDGGQVPADQLAPLAKRLGEALDFARKAGEMRRTELAAADWRGIYPTLAAGKPGLVGALMGRAEAQVTRLAMIYALLDCSPKIKRRHLGAALALWKYFEDSVVYAFGNPLGDRTADAILSALRRTPEGITRTGVSNLFSRHRGTNEITRALSVLLQAKEARFEAIETDGRAEERWFAVDQGAKHAKKAL
jgi:hypothetical protein